MAFSFQGLSAWRRIDWTARHLVPAVTLLLTVILLALPGIPPSGTILRTSLVVASVFFWSLYRPGCLPAPAVAAIGVVVGLLDASPLGLWAVLLLLEQAVVARLRRRLAETGFFTVWLVFALLAGALGAAGWLARSLFDLELLPTAPAEIETAATILLYPLAASLLARAHRGLAAPELT